ncbi:MAG: NAD-glutamate dehydrogenase domain-containing protein, partial [Sphingobium sp.]
MDARHDSSRAASAVLATAIEDSLARTEPGLLAGTRLRTASRFLADALRDRKAGEPVVLIDTGGEAGADVDAADTAKAQSDKKSSRDTTKAAEDAATIPETARRMRVAVVNGDMPFLVDSISGCVASAGIAIHIIVHPVLPVRRDGEGHLIAIGEGERAQRESVVYIEADHVDARARHALEAALRTTLRQLRAAVDDWRPMIDGMQSDAEMLGATEEGDLLRWLLRGNFTLLGHERRDRKGKASATLGICRSIDEPLLAEDTLTAAFARFDAGHDEPLILKSNRCSRVHRQVLVDLIVVPVRQAGKVKALSIHAGLWTSAALAAAPADVPVLRVTLDRLMTRFGFDPAGHAGKGLVHALTYLPHDVLLGLAPPDRERLAFTALSLSDRPRPQVELAAGALDRHLFAFVWLPRDDMTTARRAAIEQMLSTAANAPVLGWSMALDESGLALLRFVLDLRGEGVIPDDAVLDAKLGEMVRGWTPAVEAALAVTVEARRAAVLARRYAAGFPMGYREGAGAPEAAVDILRIHRLVKAGARDARLYRNPDDANGRLRLKLYSLDAITLSDAVPALENFGFRVIEELSTALGENGNLGHIQKLVLALDSEALVPSVVKRAETIERVIAAVLEGHGENDRFNDLLLSAGLEPDGVILLRAIFRYLRQTGSAYGLSTVAAALRRAPRIAADLVALFGALHDPEQAKGRKAATLDRRIEDALAAVSAIDDDRILRLFRSVIHAVLRTNAFTPAGRGALAFKIDSAQVPGLPSPVPWREIWVYSPRVEGI